MLIKANQRWLWYALDHTTNMVLVYMFGKRIDLLGKEQRLRKLAPFRE